MIRNCRTLVRGLCWSGWSRPFIRFRESVSNHHPHPITLPHGSENSSTVVDGYRDAELTPRLGRNIGEAAVAATTDKFNCSGDVSVLCPRASASRISNLALQFSYMAHLKNGTRPLLPSFPDTTQPKKPSLPRRSVRVWATYWFKEVPPHSLSAFRILFGLYLLAYFLSFAPKVNLMFSNEGITIPYLMPDWSLSPAFCTALYGLTLLVMLAFTAGYRTAWTTPAVLVLYLYFYFLNLAVKNTAYDRLNIIFLCILCLARLDRAWALSAPANGSDGQKTAVSLWPVRMITMQVSFLYFGAGLWKLMSPHWHKGEMMYYTLVGPWGSPLAFWIVRLGLPMSFWLMVTWSIVLWELSMPLGLNIRQIQIPAMLVGVAFHASVALLLNIPEFFNCVCTYVLFLDPVVVQNWGNRTFTQFRDIFERLSRQ